MLFNSFDFLIFFPIVCIVYYLIPCKLRHIFLLLASYYFYMCWNPKYAVLIFLSTLITFLSGIFLERGDRINEGKKRESYRKLCVAFSFLSNLSILFFFKYFNFVIDSFNKILSMAHIQMLDVSLDVILPVGISFYTFQALGYTMDVYRKELAAEKNFIRYALFVSFFPQLVAGPIERSKNLLRQINERHRFQVHRVHTGLIRMLWGLLQKMILSDNIAILVSEVYDHSGKYGAIELIFATVLFAFQIYCDFGGYSNIAIGAARVMGFDLMENFDAPYLADTIADFWRRWHISLTTWFRDYLYIPLGGNRRGRWRKYANIMIVFLTSGLWHGASWHFVVWGGLNGLYQIVGDLLKPVRDCLVKWLDIDRSAFSHRLLKVAGTFMLVDISWIFFRASSVSQALHIIRKMCRWTGGGALKGGVLLSAGMAPSQCMVVLFMLALLVAVDICKYLKIDLVEGLCKQGIWLQYLVCLFLIFSILIFGSYGPGFDAGQFIYFQF